ncbi:glia maturation factor beta [Eurytemora carolleeae]|uniref:glia maturation factor beta n=1 Tax=Eurytemora carolleeae TaxID=1294199 RepID=UPI000C764764|nr:glia maturation factor beta [Eurytemora carolleeae]|eukprot:XP_023325711.1 glia maturation factor beta-like [Eurytemora affinis]
MAGNVEVCSVHSDLEKQLTEFRFRKEISCAAIVMKVDKDSQTIVCDETLEDTSAEELRDSLPEHQPRFVLFSYPLQHSDGRSSFPLCFIFSSPRDCKPELQMMYAGSKLSLVNKIQSQNVYEIRELEELTDEWIQSKLVRS